MRTFADGRVFTGTQAKELGLVDELGDEEHARRLAAKLADLDEEETITDDSVFDREPTVDDSFGSSSSSTSGSGSGIYFKFLFIHFFPRTIILILSHHKILL